MVGLGFKNGVGILSEGRRASTFFCIHIITVVTFQVEWTFATF